MNAIFQPYQIGNIQLRNRIIKSGVYEGRCDRNGFPGESYARFYEALAEGGVGGIITGFAYISPEGRAMQPFQAGIDDPDKIPFFRVMTRMVHHHNCPIFLQIAHTGRQTRKRATGKRIRGVSSKRSLYFRDKPRTLSAAEISQKIGEFSRAASFAREAGFDGVQLHAAHGYLIHQFLRSSVNTRKDEFQVDPQTGIGTEFFKRVIEAVKWKCGADYPILVKISGGDDLKPVFTFDQFNALIRFLNEMDIAAIEISYGTMDHALNIFRGDFPERTILQKNPILHSRNPLSDIINRVALRTYFKKRLIPFSPAYNLNYASAAKQISQTPVISVGGFRNLDDISLAIEKNHTDLVGLARPFIREPDFVKKIQENRSYESPCTNCNLCAVMCDTDHETRCYQHINT